MTNEIRNKVLITLRENFTTEQLHMIDMAMAKALVGYKIEKEETLPAVIGDEVPIQIKEFLIRKELKGCSQGTYKLYESVLKDFAIYIRRDICRVKDTDILAYLDYRINTCGISARTANGNRLILSSFFTYMHDTTGLYLCDNWNAASAIKEADNVSVTIQANKNVTIKNDNSVAVNVLV